MNEEGVIGLAYDELKHYGILGMKWGIRRFQNADGTLTEVGKRRYETSKKTFSERVGEKRLTRRLDVTGSKNDKFAVKAGLENNIRSVDMETLHGQTKEILKDRDRVKRIGDGTIARRAGALTAGNAIGLGAAWLLAAETSSIALTGGAAAIPIGAAWLYYYRTTY